MKYYNDVQFYCRKVLKWKDDNNQPVCTVECHRAINRLSTVSRNTVGFDILCCTCGNYSDLKHNNLESIRSWERCRRENSNIAQFCDRNCTDCSEMKSLGKDNVLINSTLSLFYVNLLCLSKINLKDILVKWLVKYVMKLIIARP